MNPNVRRAALACLILAPAVAIFAIAAAHVSETPFFDEWDLVPFLSRLRQGTLRVVDFTAPQNEHRMLFPRLVFAGLMLLGKWSIRAEVYVSIGLALIQLFMFWRMARRTLPGRAVAPVTMAASLTLFHAFQTYNWLMGFQVAWFLGLTAGVAAIWALTAAPSTWRGAIAGMAATVVGSYSMAALQLLWPLGLGILALGARGRTWRWSHAGVWAAVGAASTALYFIGLPATSGSGQLGLNVQRPFALFEFVLAFIGAPLGAQRGMQGAVGMGAIGAALTVVLAIRLARARARTGAWLPAPALPWLTVLAFVVLAGGMVGAARLHLDFGPLPRHYFGLSGLFWVGLIGAHVALEGGRRPAADPVVGSRLSAWRLVLAGTVAALCIAYAQAWVQGYREIRTIAERLARLEVHLLSDVDATPDSVIQPVFTEPARLRQYARILRTLNEGVFWHEAAVRDALANLTAAAAPASTQADYEGYVDAVTCEMVSGWARNRADPSARVQVTLSVDGAPSDSVLAATLREDLVKAGYGDGRYGFSMRAPAALRGGATHTLAVSVGSQGQRLTGSPRSIACP